MLKTDLETMTVAQLKENCRQRGLTGYSKLRKAELVAELNKLLNSEQSASDSEHSEGAGDVDAEGAGDFEGAGDAIQVWPRLGAKVRWSSGYPLYMNQVGVITAIDVDGVCTVDFDGEGVAVFAGELTEAVELDWLESQALKELGFTPSVYPAAEERQQNTFVETYKDWEIYFSIPNGGICACIIIKGDRCFDFCVGDTPDNYEYHFDYLDDKGVIAHAKRAIDAITTPPGEEPHDTAIEYAIPGDSPSWEAKSPTGSENYRAITLRPLWAWAIAHAGKDIENRSWKTQWRGKLLIHAGTYQNRKDYNKDYATLHDMGYQPPAWPDLAQGQIVARASLDHITKDEEYLPLGWGIPGQYHWHLSEVELPAYPIGCNGKLGLWVPSFEIPEVFGWTPATRDVLQPPKPYCQFLGGAQGLGMGWMTKDQEGVLTAADLLWWDKVRCIVINGLGKSCDISEFDPLIGERIEESAIGDDADDDLPFAIGNRVQVTAPTCYFGTRGVVSQIFLLEENMGGCQDTAVTIVTATGKEETFLLWELTRVFRVDEAHGINKPDLRKFELFDEVHTPVGAGQIIGFLPHVNGYKIQVGSQLIEILQRDLKPHNF